MYILDTSTLANFYLGEPSTVERLLVLPQDEVFITPITVGETYFGLLSAPSRVSESRKSDIRDSLLLFPVLDCSTAVALCYAQVKLDAVSRLVWSKGMDNDIWIAAFCEHYQATLITADKDFARLGKLHISIEYIAA